MTILFSMFLDTAAEYAIKELKLAGELSDKSKHVAAHDKKD